MFENFSIKEITSVALIEPKASEKRSINYGNKIPRYELIYKLSGEVITHFRKSTYHIKPGTVYIIPKCEDARYHIERTIPGNCIDIFFDTDIEFVKDFVITDFEENAKILNLFEKALKMWLTKPTGYYFNCMSVVYEILYEMLLKNEQYSPKNKYAIIEPGVQYIKNNLFGEINYRTPSEICEISYTYFKKLFIKKFGIPPVQYVNAMRLERSKELLLTNKCSVGDVAKMCGFENTYYFSRKFKEKYGLSPTDYKKSPFNF